MRGHLLILTANVLFGISLPVFKYLLSEGFPPEAITWMRAAFACVAFWAVSVVKPCERFSRRDLLLLMVCGLCGVGINQWLFFIAILVGQDGFSWQELLAALLVFLGVWLVTQSSQSHKTPR